MNFSDSIYMHYYAICNICFFLSFFTLYDQLEFHPHLQMTQFLSFLWYSHIFIKHIFTPLFAFWDTSSVNFGMLNVVEVP